jgi:hypothetical protein
VVMYGPWELSQQTLFIELIDDLNLFKSKQILLFRAINVNQIPKCRVINVI